MKDNAQTLFTCYIPVNGIEKEGLPLKFGQIRFVRFDKTQMQNLQRTKNPNMNLISDHIRKSGHFDRTFAVCHVSAIAKEKAFELAYVLTRKTIDVLNFFSDLVKYNYGWLYLAGESESAVTMSIIVDSVGNFYIPSNRVGPIGGFSIRKMRNSAEIAKPLKIANALLGKRDPSKLDSLLLRAIQWAGRGTVEMNREQKFLLYAIALESVMLPEIKDELGYRLSVYTANLLEKNVNARRKLQREVKQLYKERSATVHDGDAITDQSLSKRALVATFQIISQSL
jgi:hypothetical protein